MQGPAQFSSRIPNSLKELADGNWQVTLHFPDRDETCPVGKGVAGATSAATTYVHEKYPNRNV